MPAVLVEIGFISNPDELTLMLTKDFQNSFANGVAQGILAVLPKANPPSKTIISERVEATSTMTDSQKFDDDLSDTTAFDPDTTNIAQ